MKTNVITEEAWAEMHDVKYKNEHTGPVGALGTGFLALLWVCFPSLFSCPSSWQLKTHLVKPFGEGQILHSMGAFSVPVWGNRTELPPDSNPIPSGKWK